VLISFSINSISFKFPKNKKDLRVKKTPISKIELTQVSSGVQMNNNSTPFNETTLGKIIATGDIAPHMDDENKKAYEIANKSGIEEAVKHMFNPTGDRVLSYSEMRARYG
jgi:hypothetical protein